MLVIGVATEFMVRWLLDRMIAGLCDVIGVVTEFVARCWGRSQHACVEANMLVFQKMPLGSIEL
jgi:hypothetical protein